MNDDSKDIAVLVVIMLISAFTAFCFVMSDGADIDPALIINSFL